jgi:hypothetical protein
VRYEPIDIPTFATGLTAALLEDGLMQIGELPGPDGVFPAWEPIDVAMDRLRERFVGHHAEPTPWDYSIWLGLTEAGLSVAKPLRGGAG